VNALYHDILRRNASAAEVAFWLLPLQANPANRAVVALDVLSSPESLLDAIDDNYREVLGRAAAPGERQLWLDTLLRGGSSPPALTSAFLASDEFFARIVATMC
jgi:hypothetical protein